MHAHIPQHFAVLPSPKEQLPNLFHLIAHDQLTNPGNSKILIFLNTTKQTQLFATLLRELSKTTLPARPQICEIHSKRTQSSRTAASSAFRRDRSGAAIFVTSDVSARGVDYPELTRVFQVGSPVSTEHSGRLPPPSHHPIPSDVAREGPPLRFPPPCLTPLPIPSLPTWCAKAHLVLPPPSRRPASPPFPYCLPQRDEG